MVSKIRKPIGRVGHKSIAQPISTIADSNEEDELLESVETDIQPSHDREVSVELGESRVEEVPAATQQNQQHSQKAVVLAIKHSHARGFLAHVRQPDQAAGWIPWEDSLDISAEQASNLRSLTFFIRD